MGMSGSMVMWCTTGLASMLVTTPGLLEDQLRLAQPVLPPAGAQEHKRQQRDHDQHEVAHQAPEDRAGVLERREVRLPHYDNARRRGDGRHEDVEDRVEPAP